MGSKEESLGNQVGAGNGNGNSRHASDVLLNLKTGGGVLACAEESFKQDLIRREMEFSLAFENAVDAIFWADAATGAIIRVNRAAEALMGRSRDELVGMSQIDLHPVDRQELYRSMFEEHFKKNGAMDDEAVVVQASGREIPVHITASVSRIQGRDIVQGVFRNIENSKKEQAALQAEQRKFQALLEATPAFICSIDRSYSIHYMNVNFKKIFGEHENATCHQAMWGCVHPCDDCEVQKVFAEDKEVSREWADAQGRVYQVNMKPYHDEHGHKQVFITGFDISKLKSVEMEREAHTLFLNTLLDTIPAPVFYKDRSGKYLGCNSAFEDCVGVERQHLIGKTVYELWPRALADKYCEADEDLIKNPGRQTNEGQLNHSAGNLQDVIFHKATYNNTDGCVGGLLGITVDITERKAMEREIAQQQRFVSSILDSLSSNICIIDENGSIAYTNAEWNRFADDNQCAGHYQDWNYLDVCDAAARAGDALALEAARGIRMVLRGDIEEYRLDYPCHSPEQHRWFNMTVRTLQGDDAHRVVISHQSITEQKLADDAVRQSEKRFREVLNNNPIGIFRSTPGADARFTTVNKTLAAMFGWDSSQDLDGMPLSQLFAITQEHEEFISLLMRKGRVPGYECLMQRIDGSLFSASITAQVQVNENKTFYCFDGTIEDITQRKAMEDELKQSEARLKDFLDNATDIIQMIDGAGKFIFVNRAWRQALGYTEEQAMNMNYSEIIHPDHMAQCQRVFTQVIQGRNVQNVEAVFRARDGREIIVEGSVNCRFVNGEPVATRAIFRDVTDRKRAELAMRESESRLRSVTDTAQDAIVMIDENGGISFWNPAAEKMFGYETSEIIGKDLHEILAPVEFHAQHRKCFSTFRKTGSGAAVGKTVELAALRKNGERFPIELSLAAKKRGQGWGAVGIIRDITERKQAMEALSESESLSRALLNAPQNVVAMVDGDFRIFAANEYLSQRFAKPVAELIGTSLADHLPDDVACARRAYAAQVLDTGLPVQFEDENKGAWFDNIYYPILDSQGKAIKVAIFATNITERKSAQVQLRNAMDDLARSNKELEEFAYVASHDLKEPLRMVVSYMQLLERRYKGQLDEKADKFIHYAVDGAMRMQKLISALLDYSRVGRVNGEFEPVNCGELMEQIVSDLSYAIQEGNASVTFGELPSVQAAPVLLGQLLQNLVANGLKYCQDPAPHVHVQAERQGAEWVFSVRDNGIGIPPEHHERIFKIFQRLHTKDEFQGTGIGLSVCKKVVEHHKGRIWVESEKGQGATFCFTIPVEGGSAA
jgi:PAS domain S-box-containing protein